MGILFLIMIQIHQLIPYKPSSQSPDCDKANSLALISRARPTWPELGRLNIPSLNSIIDSVRLVDVFKVGHERNDYR